MKTNRANAIADNPSIKGNLTAEQIVTEDWKRNYEKKGIPLIALKRKVKSHVDNGGQVVRLRNTLALLTMEEGENIAEFHTITADTYQVYASTMQLLSLSLAKVRNIETIYTYINDKSPYNMAKKLYGEPYVSLEESDLQRNGKYKLTINIGKYYSDNLNASNMQAGS